jgi:hypothetical protein
MCIFGPTPQLLIANSMQFAAIHHNLPQYATICRNSPQFAAIHCQIAANFVLPQSKLLPTDHNLPQFSTICRNLPLNCRIFWRRGTVFAGLTLTPHFIAVENNP